MSVGSIPSLAIQPRRKGPIRGEHTGLWLGSVVAEDFLRREPAASAAAVTWQTGLLEALVDQGIRMSIFGGTPHSAWPRGGVFAPAHRASLSGGKLSPQMTGYLNLPILKLFSQHLLLRRKITRTIRGGGRPAVVFSYNSGLPEALTGRWLQSELGVSWVCVVADYPETTDPRISFARRLALNVYGGYQRRWIGEAAARIYLSWALFEEERQGPKFHLDGGIAALHSPRARVAERGPRVVMFTGSLSAFTGIDVLLRAFRQVKESSCELWICGRGNLEDRVVEAAQSDPRIRYFGMVTRERLHTLMSQADVFVNPRPSSLPENRSNFPSKLLEYLKWARPVISTLTPGIAPSYRSVLLPVEEETIEGLAGTIEETLALSHEQLSVISQRIRAYVEQNLLWSVQAERLWSWLEAENLLAGC